MVAETSYKCWRFALLRLSCFRSSITDPFGHPLGALLAPDGHPRWPQEPPRRHQDGSKTPQNATRPAPGALQDPRNSAREPSRAPRRLPRAPRDPPGINFGPFGGRLGVHFDPPGGARRSPKSSPRAPPGPSNTRLQGFSWRFQGQGRRDPRSVYNS